MYCTIYSVAYPRVSVVVVVVVVIIMSQSVLEQSRMTVYRTDAMITDTDSVI